ncbi:RNA polymerase I-specific transcription initiation factor RRN3 [Microstroma glucosiphilum]|uniref:RNA polymerase I-specific transcription initiation factor RRN3 n=1 Tax=Pseudomicrostroma glucosiphilum TaxID=1684307 RepID=A0A316TZ59_9BASI|nr:RNA polymerase I-specific transcription initiation factor RRN3 [Pseudomicrostroma glucosiphilum]PWN18486.1 RNA polymerase I-specific transcription initiation factor RRN3 [Pseudomicrostroma glucosiphilum]
MLNLHLLSLFSQGSTKSYWDLVSQFRSSALSPSNPSGTRSLALWLLALSHHVSKLDMASHSQLVENILDLPWAGATDEFCKSWCRFVCALVSARTEWAANVLNRIVKALSSQTPTQPTRRLLYTRTHLLLRAVLTLIPTSVSTLNQLLVKHFPHRRESKREQATFARNILFITQYEGQVAETVWRVVADRAIGLDVEIQIELDELEEEGGGEGSDIEGSDSGDEGGTGFDDLSDEDIEDVDGDGAGGLHSDGEEEKKERKVRELVDKLDALMKVCLEHLEKMGTVDEEFEATRDALFHHLLQLFSRSILPTFKCRHVQFLLFWYCSLETDFADYFLGFLIHKAIYARSGRAEPLVLRQASASYVASFVSRAHYITPTYTRTVVLNLCSYLEAHLEAYSNAITLANSIGLHAIWYAVAQAVFYIFCFRWQDLKIGGPGSGVAAAGLGTSTSSWSQGLSILQRAVLSPLNPLQHCSGTVVRQFAAVAQHVGFLYCWSLIEANNRRSAGMGDLEGFFPFDPYRLSSTAERFVAPLYREWRDVAPVGLGGDEEEGSDEESAEDEDEEEEESTSGGEEEEEEEEEGSLTSSSQDHHQHQQHPHLALSASRPGLQIPGSGKRSHHHRRRQRSARGRGDDGTEDSSLLSASDASRTGEEGGGGGIEEGLEAMSVSAN